MQAQAPSNADSGMQQEARSHPTFVEALCSPSSSIAQVMPEEYMMQMEVPSKSWDMEPVEPEQNMAPLDMAWVQWYLQIDEFGPVTAERNDFQKYFINLQPMQTVE